MMDMAANRFARRRKRGFPWPPPVLLVALALAVLLVWLLRNQQIVSQVVADVLLFPPRSVGLILLLILVYEAARAGQWRYFLIVLDVQVSVRAALLAFVSSEVAKSLPGGNYLQNYVLEKETGVTTAYTASGTTVAILLEIICCGLYLAVVPVSGWAWLRPVIVATLAGIGGVVATRQLCSGRMHWSIRWPHRAGTVGRIGEHVRAFLSGARTILSPPVLLWSFAFTTIYVAAAGAQWYVVLRVLGLGGATFPAVLAAYCVALGAALVLPVPTDVGVADLSGISALYAAGVDVPTAIAAILIVRVLNLLFSGGMAAAAYLLLNARVIALLRRSART